MKLQTPEIIDALTDSYRKTLGTDFNAYHNHCCRVYHFCMELSEGEESDGRNEKIAIAAVFHDLGIWEGKTFDYLPHSLRMAEVYLENCGRNAWSGEIAAMIAEHHKLTPYRANTAWLVEPFRKADLTDLSLGTIRFGLSREVVRDIRMRYPNAGFHRRLLQLTAGRIRTNPLDPLPMMKW